MATPGYWHLWPNFRKLHCHEEITVIGWPHTLTGSNPSTQTVRVHVCPADQEELGTCGSPTGPHAPPAREQTLTSSSSRVQPRTGPSSSAGVARFVPSALRTRSTTASSLASGAE